MTKITAIIHVSDSEAHETANYIYSIMTMDLGFTEALVVIEPERTEPNVSKN